MLDKNGIKIQTGYVVKVSGAYFKNDNGYFFVMYSPDDPNWTGKYHSLKRIGKNGRISQARLSFGSWPISLFINDPHKKALAKDWNDEYAEIEVVNDIDRTQIMEYFLEKEHEVSDLVSSMKSGGYRLEAIKLRENIQKFYSDIVADIREEIEMGKIDV